MSEPKGSLLPANSSPLEKALDLGFGQLLDRVTPPFPALMNPLQTPAEFLPTWPLIAASVNGTPLPASRRSASPWPCPGKSSVRPVRPRR